MKIQRTLLVLLTITTCLVTVPAKPATQSTETYQQMTQPQRAAFVAEQARRIARAMSGRTYEFTPEFDAAIQKAVDSYARRVGNNGGEQLGKGDARFIFERGQTHAPTLTGIFKARGVSPLIGLYIPVVESEYTNLSSPNSVGAIGMFQFLPKTGEHYGLSPADLLDVPKSADAAARYIAGGLKQFSNDPMKEALALLAYNRGGNNVERDLASLVNEQNRACSICVLTEQRDKLDANFQTENVYYVPRFFAAAIIGENPRAFGLQTQPLSSF
jgi:transglycosylase-like protein with SLT domain